MARVILGVTAESRPDLQGFHLGFAPFFHGVRLGGDHLGPSILEALRLSAHQYGRPIAPAETASSLFALARLIEHYPHPPNTDRPAHAALVEMIRWRATSRPGTARDDAGPSAAGHSEVTAADTALSANTGREEPHHE